MSTTWLNNADMTAAPMSRSNSTSNCDPCISLLPTQLQQAGATAGWVGRSMATLLSAGRACSLRRKTGVLEPESSGSRLSLLLFLFSFLLYLFCSVLSPLLLVWGSRDANGGSWVESRQTTQRRVSCHSDSARWSTVKSNIWLSTEGDDTRGGNRVYADGDMRRANHGCQASIGHFTSAEAKFGMETISVND